MMLELIVFGFLTDMTASLILLGTLTVVTRYAYTSCLCCHYLPSHGQAVYPARAYSGLPLQLLHPV